MDTVHEASRFEEFIGRVVMKDTGKTLMEKSDDVALSDLIALYRTLERAKAVIAGARHLSSSQSARSSIQTALIQEEQDCIDEKLKALMEEIQSAPVRTRYDAIQKLRFRLIEFGDAPASAEVAVKSYSKSLQSEQPDLPEIAEQMRAVKSELQLVALALRGLYPEAPEKDCLQMLLCRNISKVATLCEEIEPSRPALAKSA